MHASAPPSDFERFARARLGPRSAALLAGGAALELARERRAAGADLEDAVLAAVHAAAERDPELADEFVAFFLADLMQLGGGAISRALRRFVDTGDLVQSVLGDLWPQLASVRFETRGRFLALLAQRVRWKAGDRAEQERAARGREERRAVATSERVETPLERALSDEERDGLALLLLRLAPRDRELLARHLRGEPADAIAAALGLTEGAARKALQRAVARAREIAR